MKIIPDLLGYRIEDALALINTNSFKINIQESKGKKWNEQGQARVIRLKQLTKDEIELIISYF
ncbi:PASTA domain-containing protein [Natronincola ferrireducens]|uniref:Uncharacterized protein n=1 Tax=Natronincola ferrireducens TaxID=393762 RepID=A0A1G9C4R2_9FIRM|nr:PASTA domain-containing protein [Natronincola ferrireducens]SDK46643.1 hypothetical protein SAMN05660472_01362 [Natronincola ferrireducens]